MSSSCLFPTSPLLHHHGSVPGYHQARALSRSAFLGNPGLGFPCSDAIGAAVLFPPSLRSSLRSSGRLIAGRTPHMCASLTELPLVWVVRTLAFYAFIQAGITGHSLSSLQDEEDDGAWAPRWFRKLFKDNESEQIRERMKLRRGWQATTKGTLRRRYRVPTKAEGRKLLLAISTLLSDDDTFRDATSHKGCQVRRENAHAQSVCCHNVRALFDELPTPHLVVEIMAFPVGPITNGHYEKAEKIEMVLRTGICI